MKHINVVYRRPNYYPKQLQAIFEPKRYSIVEASTKAGKTVGCLGWIWEQALQRGKPGRFWWWVAPVYNQSLIAFRRLSRWVPPELVQINRQELSIKLFNGATIVFKSGDNPDNLYGEDVFGCVIDEATRCKEEVFFAIRSTLTATRGPLRIIGNVRGTKNWVHKLAIRAKADPTGPMAYHTLTAYDAVNAGVLSAQEIADAKAMLPERIFKELYLAIPSDDGANPFGADNIKRHTMSEAQWEAAQRTRPTIFAWDLAKKIDWTVGIGLNDMREVCRLYRWQKPWAECIDDIVRLSAGVPTVLDSTGVGDVVLDLVAKRHNAVQGFTFTPRSKQQIMEGLAISLHEGRGPWFPQGVIVDEMDIFEYVHQKEGDLTSPVRYSAPEGMNDDCVCALAMANEFWRNLGNQATMGGTTVSL